MFSKTVKECKDYLINKKGWKLKKYCNRMNYYYWDCVDESTGKPYSMIWTMKEMRNAVERKQMNDWLDAEREKLRQGVQQSLFYDWEYAS
jgi:hypothetical protein